MGKKRYYFLLALTLILLTVSFVAGYELRPTKEDLTFSVSAQGRIFDVDPFIDSDGAYHVFIPAHCDVENVKFVIRTTLTIDGVLVSNGSTVERFDLRTTYPMQLGDVKTKISFYQADDIATMHIDTRSGNMEYIHSDKEHKESVTVTLVDENGNIDYVGQIDELKGRGNATWACRKKPYSLTLSTEENLLGMGCGEKWILLANALDESNLHNYLAFELARKTELGWTPGCAYVELYLNGEYNGLYLLTECVEVGGGTSADQFEQGRFPGRSGAEYAAGCIGVSNTHKTWSSDRALCARAACHAGAGKNKEAGLGIGRCDFCRIGGRVSCDAGYRFVGKTLSA